MKPIKFKRWRVFRGGSWSSRARNCRAGYRSINAPVYRYGYLGFRLSVRYVRGRKK